MKETEITVEVLSSTEELIDTLVAQDFKLLREVNMNDYYISKCSFEEIKKMPYSDIMNNSFLVRELAGKKELLFKKKNIVDGQVVSEEKIHCSIDNIDSAIKIFELSNLNIWCNLKQHMWIYGKDKIKFTIQQVEGLGTFIEYEEDETMVGLTDNEKIQFMLNNLRNLNIKIGDDFNCKKVFLMLQKNL